MIAENEFLILELLAQSPSGALAFELTERSDDKLKRSFAYGLLTHMEDMGIVVSEPLPPTTDSIFAKANYKITKVGQQMYSQYPQKSAKFAPLF